MFYNLPFRFLLVSSPPAAPPLAARIPLPPKFAGDAPAMPLLEGPRGTQLGLPPKSGLEPRAFLPLALSESLPELRLRPL